MIRITCLAKDGEQGLFEELVLDELNQEDYDTATVTIDTEYDECNISVEKDHVSTDVIFGHWSDPDKVGYWKDFIKDFNGTVELDDPSEEELKIASDVMQWIYDLNEKEVTEEQYNSLNYSEFVNSIENNGTSGQHPSLNWYTVHLVGGGEIDVYAR